MPARIATRDNIVGAVTTLRAEFHKELNATAWKIIGKGDATLYRPSPSSLFGAILRQQRQEESEKGSAPFLR